MDSAIRSLVVYFIFNFRFASSDENKTQNRMRTTMEKAVKSADR
jgi:hypothetical protein